MPRGTAFSDCENSALYEYFLYVVAFSTFLNKGISENIRNLKVKGLVSFYIIYVHCTYIIIILMITLRYEYRSTV